MFSARVGQAMLTIRERLLEMVSTSISIAMPRAGREGSFFSDTWVQFSLVTALTVSAAALHASQDLSAEQAAGSSSVFSVNARLRCFCYLICPETSASEQFH
jgi:hypothetical protein